MNPVIEAYAVWLTLSLVSAFIYHSVDNYISWARALNAGIIISSVMGIVIPGLLYGLHLIVIL